jgi:hypothetical protein
VPALVAQGKTDRGVAEELFVTRKTVEARVRGILAKLDLPNDASENRRVHAVLAFLRLTGSPGPRSERCGDFIDANSAVRHFASLGVIRTIWHRSRAPRGVGKQPGRTEVTDGHRRRL